MTETETVRVRCLITVGDQAEIVADVPAAEREEPARYPVAEIAKALGVERAQVPGMVMLADVDPDDRLSNWRRA